MRDVGDMHAEPKAARRRALDGDSVVEVARIDRVDGDREPVTDIAAQRVLERGRDIEPERRRLAHGGLGIAVHKPIARHHALDPHLGRVHIADATHKRDRRRLGTRGIAQHARHDHVALDHAQAPGGSIARHDEEIRAQARVERSHAAERPGHAVDAHHAGALALDHALDDGAHLAVASASEPDRHGVTVHDLAHGATLDLKVALRRAHEAAVLHELHRAGEDGTALRAARVTAGARSFSPAHAGSFQITGARERARATVNKRAAPDARERLHESIDIACG